MTQVACRLVGLKRLRNTRFGNPMWKLTLGNGMSFDTKRDSAVGYFVTELLDREVVVTLDRGMSVVDVKEVSA